MTDIQRRTIRWWAIALTALCGVAATIVLLAPVQNLTDAPQINDKLAHVIVFACLSFPALVAGLARWPVVVLAALTYGVVIELIQPWTGRSFDLADIAANLGGVMVALALAPLVRRVLRRRGATAGST